MTEQDVHMTLPLRVQYGKRLAALKNERSTWIEHWRDLAEYILPRRGRFDSTDRNRGTKRNSNIINSTATRAVRVLASGMMAGITSPARPWFRLTTIDPGLAQYAPVRSWLHVVEEAIRQVFVKSNIYNALPLLYEDMGVFGTGVAIVDEDVDQLIRAYVIPPGRYCLATDSRLRVDTMYRELSMTVLQVVERFGLANCSDSLKNQYSRGQYDDWVDVVHVVGPNKNREYGRLDAKNMAWKSCWYEANRSESENKFLQESGYREFPVLAPRWNVTGEDVYGASPGMDALGDIKALHLLEKRKAQLIDKLANPPMKGPSALKNTRVSLLPGDFTAVDSVAGGATFEPAMVVNPAGVTVTREAIAEHMDRIKSIFMTDMWLMLADDRRGQMTATEVDERHEEKMLQLGPVLERIHDELLSKLVDRTFNVMLSRNLVPKAPDELQGSELRVDFISIAAQAQKLLSTPGVERLFSFGGNLAAARPDVLDKLNFDKGIDEYASLLGVKPDLVRSDEEVKEIRDAKAQQAAAIQQQQQELATIQSAKTLSETDVGGDNALNRLVGTLGAGAPSVGQA